VKDVSLLTEAYGTYNLLRKARRYWVDIAVYWLLNGLQSGWFWSYFCWQLVRPISSNVAAANASTIGRDATVVLTVATARTKYAVCIYLFAYLLSLDFVWCFIVIIILKPLSDWQNHCARLAHKNIQRTRYHTHWSVMAPSKAIVTVIWC